MGVVAVVSKAKAPEQHSELRRYDIATRTGMITYR